MRWRGRQRRNLYGQLLTARWWVSALLAVWVYLAFRYIPGMYFVGTHFEGLIPLLTALAPIMSAIFVVMAALSAVRAWRMGRLFRSQFNLDSLCRINWRQFEFLVAELYRRRGYRVEENLQRGSDGGIDLIVKKGGEASIVQCKHWKSTPVGVGVVRELYGVARSMGADGAVVAASSRFSRDAKQFADANGVGLIDGEMLARMIRETKDLKKQAQALDYPPEQDVVPECPQCGSVMLIRHVKSGPRQGRIFYGCPNYPDCKGMVNID